jgi:lipopolysaccharide export system permease protein
MSQERELLALRAAGIGLTHIVIPAIWAGLAFGAINFWINASLGPECRRAFREIGAELITQNPMAFFEAETPIDKFSGYRLYIGRKEGTKIEDVNIWQLDSKTKAPVSSIRAARGEVKLDLPGQRLVLVLHDVAQQQRDPRRPFDVSRIRPGVRAQTLPLEIPLGDWFKRPKVKRADWMSLNDLRTVILHPSEAPMEGMLASYLTEMQKRMALAFSCFTFVLVGIPLAIQAQRKETSVGVALSLVVVFSYYFVVVLAEALKRNYALFPELIVWAPNLLFQALGFWMLWRVNRK